MNSPSTSSESDTSEQVKSSRELTSLAQTLPLCHQSDLNYRSSFASTLRFPADEQDLPESGKRELVIKRIPEESQMARRHLLKLMTRLKREAEGVKRNTLSDARVVEEGKATLRHASERLNGVIRDCEQTYESLVATLSEETTQRSHQRKLQALQAQLDHLALCSVERQETSASCACSLM